MATQTPEPTDIVESVRHMITAVKGHADDLDEQARLLYDEYADDDQRHSWGLSGARLAITRYESEIRKPRSGYLNASGRFEDLSLLPGRGVLNYDVRIAGKQYKVGDLDSSLLGALIAEYDAEIGRLAFRKAPFVALQTALKKSRKGFVRDLGEERAEKIYNTAQADA
jgi:hypothetical protein